MPKKQSTSNKKRTPIASKSKKKISKKQQPEIDSEAYQKLLGDIRETSQQAKIEEDLHPVFAEAMRYMETTLESKGYGKCEVKILANLPKVGWVQCQRQSSSLLEESGGNGSKKIGKKP